MSSLKKIPYLSFICQFQAATFWAEAKKLIVLCELFKILYVYG